jgi:hypothetical protein
MQLFTSHTISGVEAIPDGAANVEQAGLVLVLREFFVDHARTSSFASGVSGA